MELIQEHDTTLTREVEFMLAARRVMNIKLYQSSNMCHFLQKRHGLCLALPSVHPACTCPLLFLLENQKKLSHSQFSGGRGEINMDEGNEGKKKSGNQTYSYD
ncbi:uncharacterized protein LJ206_011704 isoform 2-T2 [Theristicus caerulescens]